MLGQRRRRWASILATLVERLVLAGQLVNRRLRSIRFRQNEYYVSKPVITEITTHCIHVSMDSYKGLFYNFVIIIMYFIRTRSTETHILY